MSATWQDTYADVSVVEQPIVQDRSGFGVAVYLTDSPLDGAGAERWRVYTEVSAAVADEGTGEITADALDAVRVAFGQDLRPSSFVLLRADLDNSEGVGVPEIWTCTLGANANNKSIVLKDVDNTTIATVTATKGVNADATALAVKAAWDATPAAVAVATCSVVSNVITFTGVTEGVVFSVADSGTDADTTYANTQDAVAIETYEAALADAVDGGLSFYFITAETRSASLQAGIDAWAQAAGKMFVGQSSAAGWISTASRPAAYTGAGAFGSFDSTTVTGLVYHPTDAQHLDVAVAARSAAVDPDQQAPSFRGPIRLVTTYALTASQASNAAANGINVMKPLTPGDTAQSCGPGVRGDGERLYVTLTKAWTKARIVQGIMQDVATYEARNAKPPLNAVGEAMALGRANAVGEMGVRAGHFTPWADLPNGYAFTATINVTTKVVTVAGQCRILDAVETFSFDVFLTRAA